MACKDKSTGRDVLTPRSASSLTSTIGGGCRKAPATRTCDENEGKRPKFGGRKLIPFCSQAQAESGEHHRKYDEQTSTEKGIQHDEGEHCMGTPAVSLKTCLDASDENAWSD